MGMEIEGENAVLSKANDKLRRQKTVLKKEVYELGKEVDNLRKVIIDYRDALYRQEVRVQEVVANEKELEFHLQLCCAELRVKHDNLVGFGGSSGPWLEVIKAKDSRIDDLMQKLRLAVGKKEDLPEVSNPPDFGKTF